MKLLPAGDTAVLVELGDLEDVRRVGPQVGLELVERALHHREGRGREQGVVEASYGAGRVAVGHPLVDRGAVHPVL